MTRAKLLAAVLILALPTMSGVAVAQAPPATDEGDAISASISRGKKWLYSVQKDGNWEPTKARNKADQSWRMDGGQWGGRTALATYALLASGDSPQQEHVARAIKFLRGADMIGTYALGCRLQVWSLLPTSAETRKLVSRDARMLLQSVRKTGPGKGFYSYTGAPGDDFSLSRSQYGVLGIWAAAEMGAEIPSDYWDVVEQSWLGAQTPDGGWNYDKLPDRTPTLGLTANGVATLYFTQDYRRSRSAAGC